MGGKQSGNEEVLRCISSQYSSLLNHDGFGDMTISVRILKRGQKEVIVQCGRQYRFVVDCDCMSCRSERRCASDQKSEEQGVVPSAETAHQLNDFQ